MVRRFLCGVAIAACTGLGALLAAERVTFILSDGVRLTGTVVSRGGYGNRSNLSGGDLNLRTDEGRVLRIRLDQVAVIQFGGRLPNRAELDALSYDNTQMIVRRNGSFEPGRFIDISTSGDVVRWQSRNGRQQMIPFRDLTRIYLNADRARTAFDNADRSTPGFRDRNDPGVGSWNDPRVGNRNDPDDGNWNDPYGGNRNDPYGENRSDPGADSRNDPRAGTRNDPDGGNRNAPGVGNRNGPGVGNRPEPGLGNRNDRAESAPEAASGTDDVRVIANQAWTSTRLNVRAGDLVAFRTSGRIRFGEGETQAAGPDGNDTLRSGAYPVSVMPVGGLIGRVGNSAPFPIGSNTQPIRMPANGTLSLGVNDDRLEDNSGFFTVAVTTP